MRSVAIKKGAIRRVEEVRAGEVALKAVVPAVAAVRVEEGPAGEEGVRRKGHILSFCIT